MKAALCRTVTICLCFLFSACVLTGCGSENGGSDHSNTDADEEGKKRTTQVTFLTPSADGTEVQEDGNVKIDSSNTGDGYVMVAYLGDADMARVQITDPSDTVYSYALSGNDMATLPFSSGNGSYQVDVFEHAYDDMYALAASWTKDVEISDEFKPFLYPNLYCWYTKDSTAVSLGMELSEESSDDLDYVEKVYNYVITNISYDNELAQNVSTNYIPDNENTLATGKGICFDFASLMAAMLRSQNIPTKLEVGYSGQLYHAWISVYLTETGWVDNIISFDGNSWSLMDPTLAASNSASSVKDYVNDGSNYIVKYNY